jgi:hypothetical protein
MEDTMRPTRRRLCGSFGTLALDLSGVARAETPAATPVEVWHDPTCSCCDGWVRHMRSEGFAVTARPTANLVAVKAAHGVPLPLQSCHTARAGGYVIEGHVPAADVRRLLTERPQARGLAAPGMPASAPGMDQPGEPYEVVLFGTPSGDRTWARH